MYYSGTPDGHFAPTAIPGHLPPAGILSQPDLTTNTTHLPPGVEDHLAMKLDLATFARLHQRVTLMNVPEFDWPLGHVDGANRDPGLVKTLMQDFDHDLGRLEDTYRKAGILNRTLFVITADHGFAPIYHTINATDIQNAVAAAGTSIISDSYHTAAYLWLRDPTKAAAAAENIARLQNRYIQSVYFKETIPGGYDYVRASGPELFHAAGAEAANQYLLRTFDGPAGPDVVAFFTEDSASNPGGQKAWKGDHGGNDWQAQHVPLILSGPGVRAGQVSRYPAQLMDIAPTVLSLMHMSSTGMQGTPLANAMRSTTAAAITRQQTVGDERMPVVASLQAESRGELAAGQ
jgi:arylsulfatase A-like enzyme